MPMEQLSTEGLRASYEAALRHSDPLTDRISTDQFSHRYPENPGWAVGPFTRDESLTFRPQGQWEDPTRIGWTSSSVFNPSLIVEGDALHMFYRASPRKESTASRIGLATYTAGNGWSDSSANPIVFPTTDDELLSCEDPKVYRTDDGYVLFYNGIWHAAGSAEAEEFPSPGYPITSLGCDIKVATSTDLVHWEKRGLAVPYEISRLWAKGAVIPRDLNGRAIRIGGEYLMYLSEGCGGRSFVGRSQDLVSWSFAEQPYLDLSALGGTLLEVSCAVTDHGDTGSIVLDFFYRDASGEFAAAQALYDIDAPFTQRALNRGGSLSWGGLVRYDGSILFAQGWDAPSGVREMYLYREALA
jgi:hypothetical protein